MQKVTVFSRDRAVPGKPQVLAHILQDANGKEICSAHISEVKPVGQVASVPTRIQLVWWGEKQAGKTERKQVDKTELSMRLDSIQVAPISQIQAKTLFSRNDLANFSSYDLAQGRVDRIAGELKATGGFGPR